MPDGILLYRGDAGRDKGRIVRIPVRDCPDPRPVVEGLTEAFRVFNPDAAIVWENRRR